MLRQSLFAADGEDHEYAESGFTLIELIVSMAILMLVLGMFFGTLASLTKSEDRAQRLVSNEQAVRFELDQLSREIRAANPIAVLPNPTDYSNQIEMVLGPTGGTQQVVRWTYDTDPSSPKYERLQRELMSSTSSTATVLSSSWYLTRIRNVETELRCSPTSTSSSRHGRRWVQQLRHSELRDSRAHLDVIRLESASPSPFSEDPGRRAPQSPTRRCRMQLPRADASAPETSRGSMIGRGRRPAMVL